VTFVFDHIIDPADSIKDLFPSIPSDLATTDALNSGVVYFKLPSDTNLAVYCDGSGASCPDSFPASKAKTYSR